MRRGSQNESITIHKRAILLELKGNTTLPLKFVRGPVITRINYCEDLLYATHNIGQGSDQGIEASCGHLGPTIIVQ